MPNSLDHARLTELFTEAIELDHDAQRALIHRVRADDLALATELAEMLDADSSIVTELRTAGLRSDDVGDAGDVFRRRPAMAPETVAIPGYRIARALGEGGMGVVYAGHRELDALPVAIKVLHASSPEARVRFRFEASIMMGLDHPGIARVFDSGETADGHPFIVLERVDGLTLDAFVRAHGPDLRGKLALFAAVCDAVDHAHGRGVIHRDLKPTNIMVRSAGGVAVLDFGVARAARAPGETGRTQQGDLLGTPIYMSPEQATAKPDQIDARTDLYSLGVTLFELICGQLPYDIRGAEMPTAVRAITRTPPRALGHDAALDAIVARALAKQPADRYPSAAAFAAAIRAYRS